MENLGQRIVYAMNIRRLKANRLAVLSGIHASTVKNYISNATKPDSLKLDKIAEVLDVSKQWLKEGIGEMELSKYESKEVLNKLSDSKSKYGEGDFEIKNKENPPIKDSENDHTVVSRLAKMLEEAYQEIKLLRQELERNKNN